ncbi:thioesterase II family protein [Enhygromyxa salina]|uniref:Linear gramicidin dehydrogenase LgrE n=1 Tax=Enhygromyxa salina TaxID=215803 RepID=A0A2S9Y2G2_9BACT|nr:alpha/beta fold hydrolase [Enhygromyxa salina]PRP99298.1 Linear gramicidin dehydrogenase LgrE [Enhygromyxa salina]
MHYDHTLDATRTWIACPTPKPDARARLICLPHAGASPSAFRPWADLVPSDVELLAVRLPGRGARVDEPLSTTARDITDPLARAIEPLLESSQVVIFGHSLGALLSLELVYELRRRGLRPPALLVVSGRTVPGTGRTLRLHELPDRHLIREVQRIYGGIPREILVEPAMLKRMLPILRADLAVNENHHVDDEPPIESNILALGGNEDPHVTRTELELWRNRTTGAFDCAQFDGGHFYLSSDRGQAWVLSKVVEALSSPATSKTGN